MIICQYIKNGLFHGTYSKTVLSLILNLSDLILLSIVINQFLLNLEYARNMVRSTEVSTSYACRM